MTSTPLRRRLIALSTTVCLTGAALSRCPPRTAPMPQSPSGSTRWSPPSPLPAPGGDPYVSGADGPNSFDCSGLTQFATTRTAYTSPAPPTSRHATSASSRIGATSRPATHVLRQQGRHVPHGAQGCALRQCRWVSVQATGLERDDAGKVTRSRLKPVVGPLLTIRARLSLRGVHLVFRRIP